MKKEALGRGLDALLGEVSEAYENESSSSGNIAEISIEAIEPNPYQPRKHFSQESLAELSDSIANDGLIQPIVVVEDELGGYTLVAGERRLRAAKMAGLEKIKAIVLEISNEQMQQYALIENIQREDLNPVELAKSYDALLKLHGATHEELASIVHKSRTHITNTLRLLQLSKKAQDALIEKKITAGHAKMLASLAEEEQSLFVDSIVGQKLSVREVEKMIKGMKNTPVKEPQRVQKKEEEATFYIMELRDVLKKFGIESVVSSNKITLNFQNQEQIDSLIKKIK